VIDYLDCARILAGLLLLLFLPVLLAVSMAVLATSRGPAIVQKTYRRKNGRMVDLWEFRVECWHHWKPTTLGMHLRRSNVYRLPSLLNVLLGHVEMGERVRPAAEWS
jgi:lipopolysaccharide/colanic/teichoic acid biosynthesis glycosyltransferase